MLSKLTVQNVALIRSLELDFCGRLNILSGETGAGKSILVDCLLLILGAKYDKNILRFGTDEGFVEGVFEDDERITAILTEYGFAPDDTLIVSRRFFAGGKNEIRINGKLATAAMLQDITGRLVDIYGQNEYQSLANKAEHLKIINYYLRADIGGPVQKLNGIYREIQTIERELRSIGNAGERARNADIMRFQLEEIQKAKVGEGEEEELLERRKLIGSGEKILSALSAAESVLGGSDAASCAAFFSQALSALDSISTFSDKYKGLGERVRSAAIEIADIAETCGDEISALDFDPDELEKIERRLDTLRTIRRKYGAYPEMRTFYKKTADALDAIENGAYKFEKLSKEKENKLDEAYALCVELSKLRRAGAERFCRLLVSELADLGMPGAEVYADFGGDIPARNAFEKRFTADGVDRPEFYFSANKGQPPQPLIKIISGGELSRFMLALKTVSSRTDDIATMIFDEIDTGISGKTGQEVAKKLAVISRAHQVLCVTHLPQIASMADCHYFIEKTQDENDTFTSVRLLDESGVIDEISRLSGAKGISAQSNENARQMKKWSEEFKSGIS